MTAVYNGAGAYLRDQRIQKATGAAPATADADGLFVAVLPVIGVRTLITKVADPDVPRNVTFGVVDADSSVTVAYLVLFGTDSQDRALEETITHPGGGTGTTAGLKCFKTVDATRSYFQCGPTPDGADTFQGGFGTTLGLGYDIALVADVKDRRVDATINSGSISIVDSTHGTWDVASNAPDGNKVYAYSVQSTAD